MAVDKKYLDLTGTKHLKEKLEAEIAAELANKADKSDLPTDKTAKDAVLRKVGKDSKGFVALGDVIEHGDLEGLYDNQTIKANGATFESGVAVDVVGGKDITVSQGTNSIIVAFSGTPANDNQTVKAGNVAFDANATVNYVAGNDAIEIAGDATNVAIKISHAQVTPKDAAPYKVGYDKYGHVVLGASLTYSDVHALPDTTVIGDKNLVIKTNGTTKGTFNANQSTQDVEINIVPADLGLDSALKFKGVYDTLPAVTNFTPGDVIIVKSTGKEYVCAEVDGVKKWVELGDEGSYALKTTQISAGAGLVGGGDLSANREISHATYDPLDEAPVHVGRDSYGHVKIGNPLSLQNNGAHTHVVSGDVTLAKQVITGGTSANYGVTPNAATVINGVGASAGKLVKQKFTPAVAAGNIYPAVSNGTATKVEFGTNVNASMVSSSTAKLGDATVSGTPIYGYVGFTGGTNNQAYEAVYDSTNDCLNLMPLTAQTSEIRSAVVTETLLKDQFTSITVPVINSYSSVDVAKAGPSVPYAKMGAAEDLITYATGEASSTGTGSDIVMSVAPTTVSVVGSVAFGTVASGGVSLLNGLTKETVSASIASGAVAQEAGNHAHAFNPNK